MIVKVESSLKALNQGVQKIHIISGEIKNALLNELETEEGIGTVFQKNELEYQFFNLNTIAIFSLSAQVPSA